MKKLILCLCLIPSIAFSADLWTLTFKDGTTQCGYFYLKGAEYCQRVSMGEMCTSKAEVKKSVKVTTCEEVEPTATAIPNSLKENQYVHVPGSGAGNRADTNAQRAEAFRDTFRKGAGGSVRAPGE